MTLHRWAEAKCNGDIQRDEETGVPYRHYGRGTSGPFLTHSIADREAGALRRLKAIVDARNIRMTTDNDAGNFVIAYHQTDPRGCALYLVTRAQLNGASINSAYTNGLAVCY